MSAPRPRGPGRAEGMLSPDELRSNADAGSIDTVVAAFTDMQGRLMGKRIDVSYFLDEVLDHGIEGCDYLLALDMEMDPVPGYEMASWEKGYGDFRIAPDLATLRAIPWLDRTAFVLCDVLEHDGAPVPASPRQILIAQYERAHQMGYTPLFASELEFYLYKQSYAQAHEQDFRNLTPTIPYILDYHVLATTMDEGVIGQIRRGMARAGIPVEFSKGEAWAGQHELNMRYADAITSADRHTIYKNGVKEIAFLNGVAATFMAKPSEKDVGSSCHIHSSLIDSESASSVFVDGEAETDAFRHYLGYAALLAAGLDGVANHTDPGPELVGNAYAAAQAEPFPSTLREAVDLWEGSEFAKATFGEPAWRHYLNYGRTEQRLFDQVVTDYERRRMFERG